MNSKWQCTKTSTTISGVTIRCPYQNLWNSDMCFPHWQEEYLQAATGVVGWLKLPDKKLLNDRDKEFKRVVKAANGVRRRKG